MDVGVSEKAKLGLGGQRGFLLGTECGSSRVGRAEGFIKRDRDKTEMGMGMATGTKIREWT